MRADNDLRDLLLHKPLFSWLIMEQWGREGGGSLMCGHSEGLVMTTYPLE